jgi:UDP-N-acetylmuramyl pentapeptide synthase
MDFLLSIAIPDIAIITEVFPNHIEQFITLEAYRAEKLKMTKDAKYLILHDSLRPFVDREATYF